MRGWGVGLGEGEVDLPAATTAAAAAELDGIWPMGAGNQRCAESRLGAAMSMRVAGACGRMLLHGEMAGTKHKTAAAAAAAATAAAGTVPPPPLLLLPPPPLVQVFAPANLRASADNQEYRDLVQVAGLLLLLLFQLLLLLFLLLLNTPPSGHLRPQPPPPTHKAHLGCRCIQSWMAERYTLRYSGGMVPDVHHILAKARGAGQGG